MEPPVHNLIIAMLGPKGEQLIVNMTVPEPGAKRLADALGSIGPGSAPQAVKSALTTGFNQIDTAVVNEPTPPIEAPPKGEPLVQVYHDRLVRIAEGEDVVILHDGDPLIVTTEEAADIDAGAKHVYRDLLTGELLVKDGDGKATDHTGPERGAGVVIEDNDSFTNDPRDADGNPIVPQGDGPNPTANPPQGETDGSAAGEKHLESADAGKGGVP